MELTFTLRWLESLGCTGSVWQVSLEAHTGEYMYTHTKHKPTHNHQLYETTLTNSHTHTRTLTQAKLPMRMLPFSHLNQQMYSESSHRSSTSKASTHNNTHAHIHPRTQAKVCADTRTPPQLHPLTAEVDYSRLWLSGRRSWLNDSGFFSVVLTPESHNSTARQQHNFHRIYFHSTRPPSFTQLFSYVN